MSAPLVLWLAVLTAAPDPSTAGSLTISSDSACPSAEAVRVALGELLRANEQPRAAVTVSAADRQLSIAFRLAGSARPEHRRLDTVADCVGRAAAAAIVISAWAGDLPSERLGAPTLAAPALAIPPRSGAALELGAGLLAATGGGLASGLRVELGWHPETGPGVLGSVVVTAPRSVTLGPALSRWSRVAGAIALRTGRPVRRFRIDVDAGGAGAMALAWGDGYDVDRSDQSLTWGISGGVRTLLPGRRWRLWLDVRGFAWLREQRVRNDVRPTGPTTFARLPPGDLQISLGASLAL